MSSSKGLFACTIPNSQFFLVLTLNNAYIFTNPETGEEMELSHTYIYNEDPASIEEEVLG